jgi:hypothetical protein
VLRAGGLHHGSDHRRRRWISSGTLTTSPQ